MIIYLYGPDSYLRGQRLSWYIERFKEKHSALTVERFDLESSDELPRLKDFSSAQSLFADFKFGVLNNCGPSTSSGTIKELGGVFKLATDSKSLTLAISADKKLPKEFKALSGKGVIKEEFKVMSSADFISFVKDEGQKRKLNLTAKDLTTLALNYKDDTWALITELDKLALGGSVETLREAENFFSLLTKAKQGDLASLTKLLETEEPAKVFNILASQSKGPVKIKMADYDVAIKSGKLDYEEALISLVI